MVVGGAQIYAATLENCSQLWLTRVLAEIPGDTFLPPINFDEWTCESVEEIPVGEHDQYLSEFQKWIRK
jgi:dihydrofolate reductase